MPFVALPPPPRRGSLDALLAAAAQLSAAGGGAAACAHAAPPRGGGAGGSSAARRRVARPLARISAQLPLPASADKKLPPPPLTEDARGGGGRGGARGGRGLLARAGGGARFVAGLALLPLRLLPLPRKKQQRTHSGGSGGSGALSPSSPPLSHAARERAGAAARAAAAREETRALFLHANASERRRVSEFFSTLSAPGWRLESVHAPSGTEVWRLPGGRFHTIMGVADVAAAPKTALELFQDPKSVFTRVFPRVDAMFLRGEVLASARGGFAACAARFRLPSLVGSGAAPGFPAREFVWTQYVTRLASGNVLVTARSCDGASPGAAACRLDARCPREEALPRCAGAVRGALLTSGYYGRANPAAAATSSAATSSAATSSASSRVYYIVQADPGGVLPAWLVNFAAAKQAHNVTRLAAMFRDGKLLPA
jgi:hypothetical protein